MVLPVHTTFKALAALWLGMLALWIPDSWAGESPVLEASASTYKAERGDELSFRFTYVPELNTVATVRSDGHVSLPLAGDVLVQGMSISDITAKVESLLAAKVRRPQVVVNVQGAVSSQRVYVGGEVVHAGAQPLVGPLTVMQAVLAAEGLKDTANPSSVLVLRPGAAALSVRLDRLMAGASGEQDLLLRPQDVVIVPRSGIASLNVWVDQYLRRNLPINFGVSYTINQNRPAP
jgi:protein involved in polysaccharide export with SLBB domain